MAFGAPVLADTLVSYMKESYQRRTFAEFPEDVLKFRNLMMNHQAQLRVLVSEIAHRKGNPKYTINDVTCKDISDVLAQNHELLREQVWEIEQKAALLADAIQPQKNKNYDSFEMRLYENAETLHAISRLSKNKNYQKRDNYTDQDMLQNIRGILSLELELLYTPTIKRPWLNIPYNRLVLVAKWSLKEGKRKVHFDALEKAIGVVDRLFAHYSRLNFDYTKEAVMAFWTLGSSETIVDDTDNDFDGVIALENPTIASQTASKEESVLGQFPRTAVAKQDIRPNGQYRGICKLRMSFQNMPSTTTFIGTGWLVDPYTVVTAGHNLYDVKQKTHAIRIKVSIGLNGKPPATDTGLEEQYAKSAAVHWAYYDRSHGCNDFGIVRLHTPFKDVQPILWQDAPPLSNGLRCKVVGYPGDLPSPKDAQRGCIMYESEGPVQDYNAFGDQHKLQYWPDTYGGNSGGPILVERADKSIYAIGVHTNGGTLNEGSALGYRANSIKAFIQGVTFQESATGSGYPNPKSCQSNEVEGKIKGLKRISLFL